MNFVGLGLRRALAQDLLHPEDLRPAFLELAPENWLHIGGRWGDLLAKLAAEYELVAHGLSLSLGGPDPLDFNLLRQIKDFLNRFQIQHFSEHLSFCQCEDAHLYDLLPLPFCEEAVRHVVERIIIVQDFLERRIAIENVSYYLSAPAEMSESEFISRVVHESKCDLLLDVNNCYVNATNHHYNVYRFLEEIPLDRVVAIHMAGHENRYPDMIIDTHGEPIIDPVYDLLGYVITHIPPVRVVLERDFKVAALRDLGQELRQLELLCRRAWGESKIGRGRRPRGCGEYLSF